jgi:hypothetical protein
MAAPGRLDEAALRRVLSKQDGVISRQQALDWGMSLGQFRHRVRPGGPWQRLVPGVYLTVTGTPTTRQLEIAALRYAGPGSSITGLAALRRSGVRVPDHSVMTVLVRRGRTRVDRAFVRVRPTTRMPEYVLVDGPVQFSLRPGRSRTPRGKYPASVTSAHCWPIPYSGGGARSTCWPGSWRTRRGSSRIGCGALEEVADGVQSVAEGDLRDLIIAAGLPRPMFNPRLFAGDEFLGKPDAWWPDAGVAAEVDSREWHLSPEDWERTLARHARMGRYGIVVLHFTPAQIRTRPEQVAADIRSALLAGRPLGVRARAAA